MKTIIWFVLGALFATGSSVITEVGQKITLKCGAGKTDRVEWSHGSKLIYKVEVLSGRSFKGPSYIKEKSTPRDENLEISKVEERDVGKFICKAKSGSFEQTLTVVSVSVVPSSPLQVGTKATLHCRVTELDQTSAVEWQKPDGSLETSNTVQLSPVDASHGGTWQLRVTNKEDQFVRNLSIAVMDHKPTPPPNQPVPEQPDNPNSKDVGNPTCNSTCGTNHTPKGAGKLMLLGLIWWVWVAIGVGSLVVIILIVVITVTSIRRKKRKLKMKAMLVKSKKYCQCEGQTAAPKPRQGRRREKPPALPLQPLLKEGHERGGRRGNERENGGR